MSVAENLISEIERAPEELVQETYEFQELQRKNAAKTESEANIQSTITPPDFEGRLKAIYGDRVVPSSQSILDEMREDRF